MSGKQRTPAQTAAIAHRHYSQHQTGSAAVEYPLDHTVLRADDVMVYVDGKIMRPADANGVHDYQVRGIHSNTPATAPYPGDSNTIKFTVAPNGKLVSFIMAGG